MVQSHSSLRTGASGESKWVQGQNIDQPNPVKTQIIDHHGKQVLERGLFYLQGTNL